MKKYIEIYESFDGVKQVELCKVPDDLIKTEVFLNCCYAFWIMWSNLLELGIGG